MESRDHRFSLVFNGEIYNYQDLRQELTDAGYQFNTISDSEVLLYAWAHWGPNCLRRLRGMFAFVVVDRTRKRLYAARDAFGIKPLFYSVERGRFTFASEVSALERLLGEPFAINAAAVARYVIYGDYDIGGDTFFEGVAALPAGHILELKICEGTPRPSVNRWWMPSIEREMGLSFREAAQSVRELFLGSVRRHLRSDVPIGFALSGGIDSSAVACAARYLEPDLEIRTFSYAADESSLNEMAFADVVNQHINARPYKVTPDAGSLSADLSPLLEAQGEPFGSSSIYAQYTVFREAAAQGVKVVLDGQGADEMLAGYQGYPSCRVRSMIDQGEWLKAASFIFACATWPGRSVKQIIGQTLLSYLSPTLRHHISGVANHRAPDRWLRDPATAHAVRPRQHDHCHGRQLSAELRRQLTGTGELLALLRHADRNSMHFSIENRVPFLDLDLAEFVLRLPEEYLVSPQGRTKHIFRAAMAGIVPVSILNRRDKIGFQTPDTAWVREMLRSGKEGLKAPAILNPDAVRRDVDAWLNGRGREDARWWRLVNLASWLAQLDEAGLVRI